MLEPHISDIFGVQCLYLLHAKCTLNMRFKVLMVMNIKTVCYLLGCDGMESGRRLLVFFRNSNVLPDYAVLHVKRG
jgi:hypothetical protein